VTPAYLIVVPAPFWRIDEQHGAVESAFARHLVALLASLRPHYREIVVAAPVLDAAAYEQVKSRCLELDHERDGVRFVALRPASVGGAEVFLRIPWMLWTLWREVGRAGVVHAGPSQLFTPMENLALVLGFLRGRRRVYVVDIDWRESARMNLATGLWSRGVYLRARWLHHAWLGLQTRIASRTCHVLLLKGRKLIADFGRGAPNAHTFLDAVHSSEMVLDAAAAARRRERVARSEGPLRCVYFGRLTHYKGLTAMIEAVALARARGAKLTFDIVGDGEQEAELRALVSAKGLAGCVTFHPPRPYGAEFLSSLDEFELMLAAPLSEDTPRSAVDAQSRGLPLLAFDTYYYVELAAAGASVLCTPWRDIEAFASRLVELASNRAPLADLVPPAVEFARQNTQEIWLARRAAWTLAAP
jgi:glycosyltransferase involved in cell wall biosynthesis